MSDQNSPAETSEAIRLLRTELKRVTEALEALLSDGFPMRPMSIGREGVDEWEKWHLDMERRIADAQKALALTGSLSSDT